jgi:hypothetical protein
MDYVVHGRAVADVSDFQANAVSVDVIPPGDEAFHLGPVFL